MNYCARIVRSFATFIREVYDRDIRFCWFCTTKAFPRARRSFRCGPTYRRSTEPSSRSKPIVFMPRISPHTRSISHFSLDDWKWTWRAYASSFVAPFLHDELIVLELNVSVRIQSKWRPERKDARVCVRAYVTKYVHNREFSIVGLKDYILN